MVEDLQADEVPEIVRWEGRGGVDGVEEGVQGWDVGFPVVAEDRDVDVEVIRSPRKNVGPAARCDGFA